MHFITLKRSGYVLFSTTPSGRLAVGLTERPKRLARPAAARASDWSVVREWPVEEYSHTELMLALGKVDEPARSRRVLSCFPRRLH